MYVSTYIKHRLSCLSPISEQEKRKVFWRAESEESQSKSPHTTSTQERINLKKTSKSYTTGAITKALRTAGDISTKIGKDYISTYKQLNM